MFFWGVCVPSRDVGLICSRFLDDLKTNPSGLEVLPSGPGHPKTGTVRPKNHVVWRCVFFNWFEGTLTGFEEETSFFF